MGKKEFMNLQKNGTNRAKRLLKKHNLLGFDVKKSHGRDLRWRGAKIAAVIGRQSK